MSKSYLCCYGYVNQGNACKPPNPIPPLSTLLINILAIMLGDDMVVVGSTLCVIEVNLIPTRIISCNVHIR